jgi:hypothetical protein
MRWKWGTVLVKMIDQTDQREPQLEEMRPTGQKLLFFSQDLDTSSSPYFHEHPPVFFGFLVEPSPVFLGPVPSPSMANPRTLLLPNSFAPTASRRTRACHRDSSQVMNLTTTPKLECFRLSTDSSSQETVVPVLQWSAKPGPVLITAVNSETATWSGPKQRQYYGGLVATLRLEVRVSRTRGLLVAIWGRPTHGRSYGEVCAG